MLITWVYFVCVFFLLFLLGLDKANQVTKKKKRKICGHDILIRFTQHTLWLAGLHYEHILA